MGRHVVDSLVRQHLLTLIMRYISTDTQPPRPPILPTPLRSMVDSWWQTVTS